jgi:hypothetical protein
MAQSVDCRCSRRSFMVYTRGIVWPGLLVLASCGGSSGSGDSQSLGASRTGAASAPEGFCNGLDPATSHPRFSTYEPDAIAVGAEDVPQLADGTYVLTDIQYAADCAGLGNTRTTNAILSIADAGAYNETGAGATLEISWIDSARVERRATYSVSEQYGDLFGPSANLALNHICGSTTAHSPTPLQAACLLCTTARSRGRTAAPTTAGHGSGPSRRSDCARDAGAT